MFISTRIDRSSGEEVAIIMERNMLRGEDNVMEKISPYQHIVELKELMNLLLDRAALEAYRGNLKEAERCLIGAERAILETIEIVREFRG